MVHKGENYLTPFRHLVNTMEAQPLAIGNTFYVGQKTGNIRGNLQRVERSLSHQGQSKEVPVSEEKAYSTFGIQGS